MVVDKDFTMKAKLRRELILDHEEDSHISLNQLKM